MIVVTAIYGDKGTAQLLVLSQVILSMQLPFAGVPLVRFVSDRGKMGVVGFGHGGRLATRIAAQSDIDCAVCYYADDASSCIDDIPTIRCPMVFHFAQRDTRTPPNALQRVRAALSDPAADRTVWFTRT